MSRNRPDSRARVYAQALCERTEESVEALQPSARLRVCVLCRAADVKLAKDAAQSHRVFGGIYKGSHETGIIIEAPSALAPPPDPGTVKFDDPLDLGAWESTCGRDAKHFLDALRRALGSPCLTLVVRRVAGPSDKAAASPCLRALERHFKHNVPSPFLSDIPRWELYDSFLLFQAGAFTSPCWLALSETERTSLYQAIADAFGVTHVASKGGIDRDDPSRRPRIKVLHGDFGEAGEGPLFWTSTRFKTPRGTLRYSWAPLHSMYSRGNAREKHRISTLDNVQGAVVVDLFAGIGYFSLAYLIAGAGCVFACDINPYAIEGLRRGAALNGIACTTLPDCDNLSIAQPEKASSPPSSRLNMFYGDNRRALPYFSGLATHVNLGLLPTARPWYPTALRALRTDQPGYLHIHEEVFVVGPPPARKRMEQNWAEGVVREVQGLAAERHVDLVFWHRVKSMGPATVHLVAQVLVS